MAFSVLTGTVLLPVCAKVIVPKSLPLISRLVRKLHRDQCKQDNGSSTLKQLKQKTNPVGVQVDKRKYFTNVLDVAPLNTEN